ncbi:MAG: hypothetical protein ABR910_16040 [Acidobacteriaceae bacterium]
MRGSLHCASRRDASVEMTASGVWWRVAERAVYVSPIAMKLRWMGHPS